MFTEILRDSEKESEVAAAELYKVADEEASPYDRLKREILAGNLEEEEILE